MRVIGGDAGGRKLLRPRAQGTRATSGRVREAIFDVLAPVVQGSRVLDLYAGTGALAIEALSRGARQAVLVEGDAAACRLIRRNLEIAGMGDRAELLQMAVEKAAGRLAGSYDVVLADPPYATTDVPTLLGWLDRHCLVAPRGLVVVEHASRLATPEDAAGFGLWKQRRYGDTTVSMYRRQDEEV